VSAAGLASSSVAVLGFAPAPALAEVRDFKLARATETRNTCPYCSVSCGLIIYSLGDKSKNAKNEIIHIEGDPDHPVNRGTLCPKGAGLVDLVHSKSRLHFPEVREAGSNEWKRISWDQAFERIAKHMKADRDANFIESNDKGIVNRWPTVALVGSSAVSNEAGYLTAKTARGLGMVAIETQARI
jgi:formate dehydrogenase major subunit